MLPNVRDNELFDLKKKQWLIAGATAGKLVLGTKGLAEFDRLMESLPAKHQVLIQMKLVANAEQTEAAIKAFMQ